MKNLFLKIKNNIDVLFQSKFYPFSYFFLGAMNDLDCTEFDVLFVSIYSF